MMKVLKLSAMLGLSLSLASVGRAADTPAGQAPDVFSIYKVKEASCASGKLGKASATEPDQLMNHFLVEVFSKRGSFISTETDAVVTSIDMGAYGKAGGYCDNGGQPTILVWKLAVWTARSSK